MRDQIKQLLGSIRPFDDLEKEHLLETIKWIDSGAELFRIQKPDVPPKHLVSYFTLVDPQEKKILLVDHIKSGLWLPSGGHVEKDEHPNTTVEREVIEELNMPANFLFEKPIFLTQAITVGKTAGHTDVSLWYALKADSKKETVYDAGEFNGYRWFDYNEILNTDLAKFDPHMHRFMSKFISINT